MRKSMLALTMVLMIIASLFSGCSSKTSSTQPKGEKKEITFAIALSEDEWRVMRDVVFKNFEAKTGIKVNGIQVENADIEGKLDALKQAGKADIDVVAPDNMLLAGLVNKGLVKDLSQYESKIPSQIGKNLYADFKVDGKLYFMPFRPNVQINYYNETKFNQYGLKPPTNWDELMNVAKTFYEKENVGRVAIQGNMGAATTVTMFEFIKSAGGDPVVLNDEGSVKAFTYLQQLWKYLSPDTKRANFNIVNQILANESVYYASNWPFATNVVVKDGGKKQVKANAGFTGPVKMNKVLGGNVLAVAANTTKLDESMQFIDYLMSKEAQETFCSKAGWPPARDDAYGTIEDWQKPYFESVKEAMKYAEVRPILPYWSEVDKAINDAFKEIVMNGNKDIKGVLDKEHAAIEQAKNASKK